MIAIQLACNVVHLFKSLCEENSVGEASRKPTVVGSLTHGGGGLFSEVRVGWKADVRIRHFWT